MAEPKPLPPMTPDDVARFWSKVAIAGPRDCWEWRGARQTYGVFQVAGRAVKAHRVAYFLATGQNPSDRLACHSCDNPPCCNPAHLFPGTHADNAGDRSAKGRDNHPIGQLANGSRLSAESVQTIRALYETGQYRQSQLAEQFGVSRRTISAVVTGQTWNHLPILLERRRRVR